MATKTCSSQTALARSTPGPWHWENARTLRHLSDANGSCFAGVNMPLKHGRGHLTLADSNLDADAALIASAPALLEALASIVETVLSSDTRTARISRKQLEQAQAALKQAGVTK